MKYLKTIVGVLSLLVLLTACDTTPEFISGEFKDDSQLISESERYSARYFANQEEVKLVIEDLLNTSDNRNDEYPAIDFCTIRVDMNNNNLPDNEVDKSYGFSTISTPCMQFVLLDGGASTACMEEDGFRYEKKFISTDRAAEEHLVYELIIRQENLFVQSDTIGLIFVLNGNDAAGSDPFLYSPLFKETIAFSL